MPTTSQPNPQTVRRDSGRSDLEGRYGSIGISAVAAAARYQTATDGKRGDAPAPALDPRFEEEAA